jgi:hypothetical protein
MRLRDERERRWSKTTTGGACSCLHGFVFWPGEKNPCPKCAAERAAHEAAEESRRGSLVAEVRSASERVFDEGTPLAEAQVSEVETCDGGKKMKNLYIKDPERGIEEPAYLHADGTLVSLWDGFEKLLIKDETGTRRISHSDAVDLGYEK